MLVVSGLPPALDRFVTLAGVVVDARGREAVQETLVELQHMPEMTAHSMGSQSLGTG